MPAARAVCPARVIALPWVAPPGRYVPSRQLPYEQSTVDPDAGDTETLAVTPSC